MKFLLLVVHFGFWCGCWEKPVEIAHFSSMEECEKASVAFAADTSNRVICTQVKN